MGTITISLVALGDTLVLLSVTNAFMFVWLL